MNQFKDNVAVITGAASGIGAAIADRCAQEGMRVVLADVDEETLAHAEARLKASGASVLAVRTDVSQARDVEALARKTVEVFGTVDLLCNNAGIARIGSIWESAFTDWESVIGVNLWGVINGVRVFVPIMLAQETECHVVNTASLSGLISAPGGAAYNVAKHAVVTLSETLYHELAEREAKISVSVLCPGMVNTRIVESMRNGATGPADSATEARLETLRELVQKGMPAAQVADAVFEALRNNRFYILTHPDAKDAVRTRLEDIIEERNPTPIV